MWLRALRVRAFGALRDSSIELASGLNIVHGPNESAKSTWHAALTVGLCGRRRGAGRRADDARFEARHRPWDDAEQWAVNLALLLDDGREIEIDRDLAQQRATVVDTGLGGRAVDDDIVRDGSPDGAVWLGLDRASFHATASVRQAEILAVVAEAEGLRDHLARAATGGAGVTAAAALERLARFQKEQVGLDKTSAVKPLRKAVNALAEAQADLDAVRARHTEYQQLVVAADESHRGVGAASRHLRAAEATVAVASLREAEERMGRLEVLASEFPDGEPADIEEHNLSEVARVVERYRSLPLAPTSDLAEVHLLEDQLTGLADPPVGPVEVPEVVVAAIARYRASLETVPDLLAPYEPVGPGGDPAEVQGWVEPLRAQAARPVAAAEADLWDGRAALATAVAAGRNRRRAAMFGWGFVLVSLVGVAAPSSLWRAAAAMLAVVGVAVVALSARRIDLSQLPDVQALELAVSATHEAHRLHVAAIAQLDTTKAEA